MKTFLKFTVALFVFGFATANAAEPKSEADVKKAVTDAIAAANGDETKIAEAISSNILAYPDFAQGIVAAGLSAVASDNLSLQKLVVRVAAWNAPDQVGAIKSAIQGSSLAENVKTILNGVAGGAAAAAKGNQSSPKDVTPPATLS